MQQSVCNNSFISFKKPLKGKFAFGILFSCNVLNVIWPSVMFSSLNHVYSKIVCISGINITPSYLCSTPGGLYWSQYGRLSKKCFVEQTLLSKLGPSWRRGYFVVLVLLPPVSAVEVIESVLSYCVSVCLCFNLGL